MRFVGLLVEVEGADGSFPFCHIGLLLGHPLSVQAYIFIDTSDAVVVAYLLVDFSTVRLVDPDFLSCFVVEVGSLLKPCYKVGDGSVLGYKNLEGLLYTISV